jgi:hypothetical protein
LNKTYQSQDIKVLFLGILMVHLAMATSIKFQRSNATKIVQEMANGKRPGTFINGAFDKINIQALVHKTNSTKVRKDSNAIVKLKNGRTFICTKASTAKPEKQDHTLDSVQLNTLFTSNNWGNL